MPHLRSFKLTHTKNTTWRRARDGASDIIHAEGVRGDFPSSAPKARNPLTSHEELRVPAKKPPWNAPRCRSGKFRAMKGVS
jgi:hypothetical protein